MFNQFLHAGLPSSLLQKRLLVFSGKGGVGKTSIALAVALAAAACGKKTALVEVNDSGKIAHFFNLPPIGYAPVLLEKNLFAANLNAKEALREYVLEQIHSQKLYELVFENRFSQNFLGAAPGLNEMLQIGKVWAMAGRDRDAQGDFQYDLVILDAPAMGHGLAFLKVPQILVDVVRLGPLQEQGRQVLDFIRDPEKTLLVPVCLPEEMPVNETLEMIQKAKDEIFVSVGPVILNQLWPERFTHDQIQEIETCQKTRKGLAVADFFKTVAFAQKKVSQQKIHQTRLKEVVGPKHVIEVPFLFTESFGYPEILKISQGLVVRP